MTARDIILAVCQSYDIKYERIIGDRRTVRETVPRHIAMFLCRAMLRLSYPDIGRAFGGKDHTTAMHACRRVAESMGDDPDLRIRIAEIREAIEGVEPCETAPTCLGCMKLQRTLEDLRRSLAMTMQLAKGAA